jgi:phage repressor protein C with HTH and peptisase S24 domain
VPNHDLNTRFKALLAQAEKKFGWGAQTKLARVMETTSASVSAWKKTGFTGTALQLDALSRELGNEQYPVMEPKDRIVHDAGDRLKQAWREAMDAFTAPIIAYAQGGEGAYPEDLGHAVPRIAVPCKDPNCYVLELEGDSMEPVYLEGDLLVVAPNMEPMNNDLVIVKTAEEEVFFKKLKKRPGSEALQFHSFNPHHPPIHLRIDEIYRVSVVHSVIRPLKERVRAMTVSESVNL